MSAKKPQAKFTITQAHIQKYKTILDGCYNKLVEFMKQQEQPHEEAKQWKSGAERDGVKRYDRILPKGTSLPNSQLSSSKTKVTVGVNIHKLAEFMLDTAKANAYDSYYNGTNMLADLTKFMEYEKECKPKDHENDVVTRTRLLHMKYKGFLVVGPRDFLYLSSFKKIDPNTIVIATISVEHENFKEFKGHTRGHMGVTGSILQAQSPTHTHITNIADVDMRGWMLRSPAVVQFTQTEEINILIRLRKAAEAWSKNLPIEVAPAPAITPEADQPQQPPQEQQQAAPEEAKPAEEQADPAKQMEALSLSQEGSGEAAPTQK
jgi:hypothetical protein